ADVAIILIDARQGVLTQTKRHSYIATLLGIKNLVIAINKMDLVGFSQDRFDEIVQQYKDEVLKHLNTTHLALNTHYIPISALDGDNIVSNSAKCSWYKDLPLMELLDSINLSTTHLAPSTFFRLPVQYVNRPHLNFRGFCGTIASGTIKVGDSIMVLPSKKSSKVKEIINPTATNPSTTHLALNTLNQAYAPMATTITLEDEIDISRGDMIVKSDAVPHVSNRLSTMIVWMSEVPMHLNSSYIIKRATSVINGSFEAIEYKKDVNTFQELQTKQLELNDIAKCTLKLDRAIAVDSYETNRYTGSFIIIDRYSNETLGAGMIVESVASSKYSDHKREYSDAERALNEYIRIHYPEWECKEI
ncbi:MAG: sulfate adenylyltransferase subunit 1, partial [Campylobacterota bacterium]